MSFAQGRAKTGGRRKGSPNKGTERARRLISEADDKAIVDQIVRDAKASNPAALTLDLRYSGARHCRVRPPSGPSTSSRRRALRKRKTRSPSSLLRRCAARATSAAEAPNPTG